MKNIKYLVYAFLALNVLFFTACDNDDEDTTPPPVEDLDIVGTALATDDLSILVDALTQADLVTTLQGDGPFTVFAPTNTAFVNLLAELEVESLNDIATSTLEATLNDLQGRASHWMTCPRSDRFTSNRCGCSCAAISISLMSAT